MKKNQNPAIAHAVNAGRFGRCGYRRRARTPACAIATVPSSTISTRGQTSLTPPTHQPAWISQGKSGVLCEYGAPLNSGTSQLPRSHISQATASVRVEYSGTGPCRKIDSNASALQANKGARKVVRVGRVIARRISQGLPDATPRACLSGYHACPEAPSTNARNNAS